MEGEKKRIFSKCEKRGEKGGGSLQTAYLPYHPHKPQRGVRGRGKRERVESAREKERRRKKAERRKEESKEREYYLPNCCFRCFRGNGDSKVASNK
jgi:hypothetical protein